MHNDFLLLLDKINCKGLIHIRHWEWNHKILQLAWQFTFPFKTTKKKKISFFFPNSRGEAQEINGKYFVAASTYLLSTCCENGKLRDLLKQNGFKHLQSSAVNNK